MCSRIQYKTGGGTHIIGRNMDWTEKMGTKLYVFPKGIERQGLAKVNPAKWTSKYGGIAVAVWDVDLAGDVSKMFTSAEPFKFLTV